MSIKFGPAKPVEQIKADEALKYPIWLWVWETGEEQNSDTSPDQDESWLRPLINTTNVTPRIFEPIITVRVRGTNIIGSASYDQKEEKLDSLAYWKNGTWQVGLLPHEAQPPLVLVAVPSIRGKSDVEFVAENLNSVEARRVSKPGCFDRLRVWLGW